MTAKTVHHEIILDEGEPFFVLRGNSPLAPQLVSIWAACAKQIGRPEALLKSAMKTADEMRAYLKVHDRQEFPVLAAIESAIMVGIEDTTQATKESH